MRTRAPRRRITGRRLRQFFAFSSRVMSLKYASHRPRHVHTITSSTRVPEYDRRSHGLFVHENRQVKTYDFDSTDLEKKNNNRDSYFFFKVFYYRFIIIIIPE